VIETIVFALSVALKWNDLTTPDARLSLIPPEAVMELGNKNLHASDLVAQTQYMLRVYAYNHA
jgi:hypothetical protein